MNSSPPSALIELRWSGMQLYLTANRPGPSRDAFWKTDQTLFYSCLIHFKSLFNGCMNMSVHLTMAHSQLGWAWRAFTPVKQWCCNVYPCGHVDLTCYAACRMVTLKGQLSQITKKKIHLQLVLSAVAISSAIVTRYSTHFTILISPTSPQWSHAPAPVSHHHSHVSQSSCQLQEVTRSKHRCQTLIVLCIHMIISMLAGRLNYV